MAITGALKEAKAEAPLGLSPALAAPTGTAGGVDEDEGTVTAPAALAGTTKVVGATVAVLLLVEELDFPDVVEEVKQEVSELFLTVRSPLQASLPALSTRES